MERINKNTGQQVTQITESAFQKISEIENIMPSIKDFSTLNQSQVEAIKENVDLMYEKICESISILNNLHGIGYATSTAILSAVCPLVPFMSDQVIRECEPPLIKNLKYNDKVFKKVFYKCFDQYLDLVQKDASGGWTCQKVQESVVIFILNSGLLPFVLKKEMQ